MQVQYLNPAGLNYFRPPGGRFVECNLHFITKLSSVELS